MPELQAEGAFDPNGDTVLLPFSEQPRCRTRHPESPQGPMVLGCQIPPSHGSASILNTAPCSEPNWMPIAHASMVYPGMSFATSSIQLT